MSLTIYCEVCIISQRILLFISMIISFLLRVSNKIIKWTAWWFILGTLELQDECKRGKEFEVIHRYIPNLILTWFTWELMWKIKWNKSWVCDWMLSSAILYPLSLQFCFIIMICCIYWFLHELRSILTLYPNTKLGPHFQSLWITITRSYEQYVLIFLSIILLFGVWKQDSDVCQANTLSLCCI